ncbi:MAG: iron transporter [Solirubrobacteraceae bacterium]
MTARRVLVAVLVTVALAGCASADKHQATTKKAATTGMAGMNMGGGSGAAPSANGVKPVAIRTLATSYWQDMEIQAQTMTPVSFVVFTGNGKERLFKPPKHAAFHLMIMLTDRHTHFHIPYASVWATITSSAGQVLYNDQQWPMISEYMGSHYGNNVPHLAPGRYTLKLLISPPVSARHLEYQHLWHRQHVVIEHFTWKT